jgi:hypothetical protein
LIPFVVSITQGIGKIHHTSGVWTVFESFNMTQLMYRLLCRPQEEEVGIGRETEEILPQSGKGYQGPSSLRVCQPEDEIEPWHKEILIHNSQYAFVSLPLW